MIAHLALILFLHFCRIFFATFSLSIFRLTEKFNFFHIFSQWTLIVIMKKFHGKQSGIIIWLSKNGLIWLFFKWKSLLKQSTWDSRNNFIWILSWAIKGIKKNQKAASFYALAPLRYCSTVWRICMVRHWYLLSWKNLFCLSLHRLLQNQPGTICFIHCESHLRYSYLYV